tara:strand:+ start:298 stop:1191 length:894 start_codon:yes stop_codon:yes gene_type:complete
MAYTPSTPPAFLNPAAERITDLTIEQLNRPVDTGILSPKVAGFNPLLQQAQQRATTQAGLGSLQYNPQGELTGIGPGTGVASYEPYLQSAETAADPSSYQSYMSPYQTEVIDASQALMDEQRATGLNTLRGSQYAQGAYGQGRGQIGEAEYLRGRDISDAGTMAALRQEGFTQAQKLKQQDVKNQLGFGREIQSMEDNVISGLGVSGAGAQGYSQSILDAIQQGNITQEQFPLDRLKTGANIFSGIAGNTPQTPGQPIMTSPGLVGAQTLASLYGNLSGRENKASGGLMSLLTSLGV